MKFSAFFTSSGLRKLAIWLGILTGLGVSMFADWKYGVLIGAVVVLLTSLILPVIFYLRFLPYAKLKRTIEQPFLFDAPVRFTVKTGTVGGFFILTERSMIFLSLECADNTLELTRDKVKRVALGDATTLDIYLNNTQFVRVFCAAREEIVSILRDHGWSITE